MQIFLSYAPADEAFAKALSSQLRKKNFSVWDPNEELLPGDNFWRRTGDALEKSNAMVVLVSPDSMRSENVRRELEYAMGAPKYEGRLFPVEVRRTPKVPWILRKLRKFEAGESPAKISQAIASALKKVA